MSGETARGFFTLLLSGLVGAAVACGPAPAPTPTASQHFPAASKSAPHFVDAYPHHGDLYTEAPRVVRVNFDFTLHPSSRLTVLKDGAPIPLGTTKLSENMLSISAPMEGNPGDGSYLVQYKACWPDQSCHDGEFAFRVEKARLSSYKDLTSQKEVTINMRGLKFEDANIIISRGTKVTWSNAEAIPHFVNTDPHPSHNGLQSLNSLDINLNETYSYTFDVLGEWGYHCSAHFPQGMVGKVVVR